MNFEREIKILLKIFQNIRMHFVLVSFRGRLQPAALQVIGLKGTVNVVLISQCSIYKIMILFLFWNLKIDKLRQWRELTEFIVFSRYRITKDDCAKFLISVSLYSWFPPTLKFSFFTHWMQRGHEKTFFQGRRLNSTLRHIKSFMSSLQSHLLWVTLWKYF